jgi:hypothetical protein
VVLIVVFLGDRFLFDTMRGGQNQPGSKLIVSGLEIFGYSYDLYGDYSVHMTYVFNVFVMMTFFNFWNCRVINDEPNLFYNLHRSHYFLVIMAIIFCL